MTVTFSPETEAWIAERKRKGEDPETKAWLDDTQPEPSPRLQSQLAIKA